MLRRRFVSLGAFGFSLLLLLSFSVPANAAIHSKGFEQKTLQVNLEDIRNLKELNGDQVKIRQQALGKYKKAIKLVEQYAQENDINIITNLDNKEFQSVVKLIGGEINYFSEEETDLIIEFVKFMDFYENFDQNKVINKYKQKIKNKETLNNNEKAELLNLIPASNNNEETKNDETAMNSAISLINNLIPKNVASAGTYNRWAARDYARQWTTNDGRKLRNNSQYGYYSDYYNCTSCWNDCTNFVSQALKAGGMRNYWDNYWSDGNWYYSDTKPSYPWGGAHNFYMHWKWRAGVASSSSYLQTGDVVNADFGGDGHIDHTAIITYTNGSGVKWLTQHTSDKEELTNVGQWYNSGYKVYGYEMDKASN